MNNQESEQFWAIVELFGHTVLAGQVSKSDIGDFIQINIPKTDPIPAWTKLVNPKSIYSITPTTEDVAIQKAISIKAMPIDKWDTNQLFQNRLSELVDQGVIKQIETSIDE